jgi:hypothetical protein
MKKLKINPKSKLRSTQQTRTYESKKLSVENNSIKKLHGDENDQSK